MNLTLGQRCVKFMEDEMKANVTCNPNLPATPRVKEYFSICTRKVNGKETPIKLTQGNWCAAAISFSLYSSIQTNEEKPHNYRVGCVEIMQDLMDNHKWYTKDLIKRKIANILPGDIVITDRSNPSNPNSSWWRHILRVVSVNDDGTFRCISGNSIGGRYQYSNHSLDDKNLIGFGLVDPREIKTLGIIYQKPEVKEEDLNPSIESFHDLYDQVFEEKFDL